MTTTETILQCGLCHRQHDGAGDLQAFVRCVPQIVPCGREDCAALVAEQLAEAREVRRRRCAGLKKYRETHDRFGRKKVLPPSHRATEVSPQDFRSSCPPERDFEPPPAKDVSALDFETSANRRLLDFFRDPKNFNRWFSAKFLEDEIGRTSGRMNNRAIWLRAQFNVAGLELDQHACPPGENLPNGSYYRLCRIEDALRLSDAEKHRLKSNEKLTA